MLFYDTQPQEERENYKKYLSLVCSLSKLFSTSKKPYLYYRLAENLFCEAFHADNLSRSDCSADAMKKGVGIGLKTFLHLNAKTYQKVAEFNKDRKLYSHLQSDPKALVLEVCKLRNKRIAFTKRAHAIEEMIYHCVTREEARLNLYECKMDMVDLDSVELTKSSSNNSIAFKDKLNEYSFNLSKSTLLKRFFVSPVKESIGVEILKNPLELLLGLLPSEQKNIIDFEDKKEAEFLFLPLYAKGRGEEKGEFVVPPKSGLNQWNAEGRKRDENEIYIPIPAWIHRVFEGFFPPKDVDFTLVLPDNKILSAKLCQQGSKALMSNPNKALGKWLLRDVLALEKNELLTYKKLEDLGIDSVRVDKISKNKYSINFCELGSFEDFEKNNKEA